MSFLLCRDYSYTIEDVGDLRVVIVVQCPEHVGKTEVLSNSHPCCNTHYRCCCGK